MLSASNLLSLIPVFILVAIIASKYYTKHGGYPVVNTAILTTVLLIIFLFCFKVVPEIFSFFIERPRPCVNPNISLWVRLLGEECNNTTNFLPTRPCIVFCIASFLLFTFKNDFPVVKILFVLWALLVSYSRIYLGAYYPSSVIISGATGFLAGYLGSRIYFYLKYQVLYL